MHRVIRDNLEQVLADSPLTGIAIKHHLDKCDECRGQIVQMREHAQMLRALRSTQDIEPRPGFYARVMERIEAEGPASIWHVFSESPFGRRIAVASMALALSIGVYMFTAEQPDATATHQIEIAGGEDQPGIDLTNTGAPDRDAVLVNLVTYRGQ